MEKVVSHPLPPAPPTAPDFPAVKARQRATWSSGDHAVVGTTLQIVARFNRSGDGTVVVPGEHLQTVVIRR